MNYKEVGSSIGHIVDQKNKQYGNAINDTEDFLRLLYPCGIAPSDYKNIGILVRIFDKIKRIANGNKGDENAYMDIAGYAILMSKIKEEKE